MSPSVEVAVLHKRPASVVVGRERERRVLRQLVESIASGGRAAAVVGEVGAGKTTMLRLTAAGAGAVRTIWLSGVESEAALPFAAAADLLLPLAEHFARLPPAQCEAMQVALALRPGHGPGMLSVCAAGLGVLAAESERAPLLILVDDWQWIDRSSQQILLFVARRLAAERVGLVLAMRAHGTDEAVPSGMPVVRLPGLTVAEGRALADGLGIEVSDDVLEHLGELTGGNPLALTEALTSAPWADLVGPVTTFHGLAIGSTLRRAWAAVLDDLPPATSTALFVASASRAGALDEVEAALIRLGGDLSDLAPAERRDLVRVSAGGVQFRHPLLRQVVVDRTPASAQWRVHRALADTADGHRRAWYSAAVATPPDDAIADALDAAATDARDRSDHAGAAQAWNRAAEFTTDAPRRGNRLLAAATVALHGGRDQMAVGLAGAALAARCGDPAFAADAEVVRARASVALGRPRRALDDLMHAAAAAADVDPERAGLLYTEAIRPCVLSGDLHGMLDIVDRGMAVGTGRPDLPVAATSAAALAMGGRTAEARVALDRAEEVQADRFRDEQDLRYATFVGQAATYLEEYERGGRLLRATVDGARTAASPAVLATALLASVDLAWWTGAWSAGRAEASEVVRSTDELGEAGLTALALVALARFDAARGDSTAVRVRVERAGREVGSHDFGCMDVHLPAVSGFDALSNGRLEEAAELLERAVGTGREQGLRVSTVVPTLGDLIEVRVRLGDRSGAQEAVGWAEEEAEATGLAYPAALAARGRGAVATDVDEAVHAFARAHTVHARCRVPFEQARTLLCEGETLRRLRRPAAARRPLQEALRIFDRLEARHWSTRARAELAATGAPGGRGDSVGDGVGSLTPQEFQVARAVADGLSNLETAGVVFLSRKTVEAHLSRIYRKLGIRSRSELARLFGEQHVERASG